MVWLLQLVTGVYALGLILLLVLAFLTNYLKAADLVLKLVLAALEAAS